MTPRVLRMIEERCVRDREGRPLREGRTPAAGLVAGDIEYRACPHAGARHGRPMNVSALRQAAGHWDAILELLAGLRAAHDDIVGTVTPTPMDLWRTSQLGSALPWFHLFRDGAVPPAVAALAKMTLGLGIWAQRAVAEELVTGAATPALTPEVMLALVHASGTLLGEHEVCGGSDKQLARFFAVLVEPCTAAPADLDAVRFGAWYAGWKLVLWIHSLARRFVCADLGLAMDAPVQPPDFALVEPAAPARLAPAARAAWFGALAARVVAFAPDGKDGVLAEHAREIADAMGAGLSPAATAARIDAVLAAAVADVERGLGGAPVGLAAAAVRDRIVTPLPVAA